MVANFFKNQLSSHIPFYEIDCISFSNLKVVADTKNTSRNPSEIDFFFAKPNVSTLCAQVVKSNYNKLDADLSSVSLMCRIQ